MNRKKIFSILQYLAFLALAAFLVWWQMGSLSADQKNKCFEALKKAKFWLLIPVGIMALASHYFRAQRWRLMMEPMGFSTKLSNTFCAVLIGYFANTAVPRLGEVLKCTVLAKYEKIPAEKLVGTIIIERIFDVFCFAIFIGITLLLQVNKIGELLKHNIDHINPIKIIILFSVLMVMFFILKYIFRNFKQNKWVAKVASIASGFKDGFMAIKNLKAKKDFVVYSILIWAMYVLQIYVAFFSIPSTSGLSLSSAFSVLLFITLAMIFTPSGIGVPPLVAKLLLLYGITADQGTAFGWIIWGAMTGIIILAGVSALAIMPIINKNYHPIETDAGHST